MRFQPPGPGRAPSGIARPAELVGPLSNSRNEPSATSAKAGAAFERRLKPRCFVYQATAASTSLTMYRTLTVDAAMFASLRFRQSQGALSAKSGAVIAGQPVDLGGRKLCRDHAHARVDVVAALA